MNTSNPALRQDAFRGFTGVGTDRMTINGTIGKSLILLILVLFSFTFTWNGVSQGTAGSAYALTFGGMIVGLILSLVISFKQTTAPFLAPVFALAEGLFLGGVSASYELAYGSQYGTGIAVQALLGTICVFGVMLTLFRSGVIKVTDRFRAVVGTAMLSIFALYLVSFLLSFARVQIPGIFGSGLVGIGFSLVVIGVASLMLVIDFDMIQRGASGGAPKYMEWYGAFALLVTIVWIYLEMLRLLSKLRSR